MRWVIARVLPVPAPPERTRAPPRSKRHRSLLRIEVIEDGIGGWTGCRGPWRSWTELTEALERSRHRRWLVEDSARTNLRREGGQSMPAPVIVYSTPWCGHCHRLSASSSKQARLRGRHRENDRSRPRSSAREQRDADSADLVFPDGTALGNPSAAQVKATSQPHDVSTAFNQLPGSAPPYQCLDERPCDGDLTAGRQPVLRDGSTQVGALNRELLISRRRRP